MITESQAALASTAEAVEAQADTKADATEKPSDVFVELAAQVAEEQERLKMEPGLAVEERSARDGGKVFVVRCPNGEHTSTLSPEDALRLLVESFRPRVEDLPATHERIKGKLGEISIARLEAQRMAKTIADANPDMSGEDRDSLFLAALDKREADTAAGMAAILKEREGRK